MHHLVALLLVGSVSSLDVGGVISLDTGFQVGKTDATYLYTRAAGDVTSFINGSSTNVENLNRWSDSRSQGILKTLGADAKARFTPAMGAITNSLHADPLAMSMYKKIEQELMAPETVERILEGATSLEDFKYDEEKLQVNLVREVELLKAPLHSFMQVVSDQAIALGLVRMGRDDDWYGMEQLVLLSPGFSWQIILEQPSKMFVELQTQINYKRTLSDTAGDKRDDLGLTFDLTTSIRCGLLVDDIAKIWASVKVSEMSTSFGAGGIAGSDVDYTDSVQTLVTTPVNVESGKRGKSTSRDASDGKDTLLTEPPDASVREERALDVPEGLAGRRKRMQQKKQKNSKRVSPVASAVEDDGEFEELVHDAVDEAPREDEAAPVVADTDFPDLGSKAGEVGDEAPHTDETADEAPQADETADEALEAGDTADNAPSVDETADEPALEFDDEMPEAPDGVNVLSVRRHVKRGQNKNSRKKRKLGLAKENHRHQPKNVNLLQTAQVSVEKQSSLRTRSRIFMHQEIALAYMTGDRSNPKILLDSESKLPKKLTLMVDFGINFFDDGTKFAHHLELQFIVDFKRYIKSSVLGIFAISKDGDWRGGGGLEVTVLGTRSVPPTYKNFGRFSGKALLHKILVNLRGGFPKVWGTDKGEPYFEDHWKGAQSNNAIIHENDKTNMKWPFWPR
jgi:hypothetical protein